MSTLLLLVTFVVLAVGVFAMLSLLDKRKEEARIIRERLAAVTHAQRRGGGEELDLLRDELLSEIPALHRMLARSSRVFTLQRWLTQSGIEMRAGKFLLTCASFGALFGTLELLMLASPLILLLAVVFGGMLPVIFASIMRARRFHKFEEMFPEAVDLLARSIRAGHSMANSLEIIGNELPDPVSLEFRKLFEEQKFGLPMRDALLNLSERMPLMDVKFFVTAIMLQRETGGNLAEILDKLSMVIRERFKILRQVRIHTAQGRMTLGILMALPPALMVVMGWIDPEFVKPLFTDPLGHVLLFMAATLQIMGFFLIRRIINIKV